ncbi:hypothetical protein SO802_024016 [Lithocarpus litseifolius]|uniref:Zinc knuckle CX2CX4HX4C domain-containing protein n=1 Tax=Lithocarpus litseifolius TaxID=425828 RepID=A0AAW2C8C7_9ROSI
MHHILVSYLNKGVVEDLCEVIGVVDRSANDTEVDRGSFFQIQVRVDISMPLCRGQVLSMEDGEECWVSFKYERLPNICYWCGCLDHSDRDCVKWIESDGTLDNREREYGPWIRAAPNQMRRKSMVVVPGFYEARKKGGLKSNTSVTEIQKPVRKEGKGQANHANLAVEKIAVNSEEENTEEINALENSVPETIDRELNSVEIYEIIERGEAKINKEVHVESPNVDTSNEPLEILETGLEPGAGHVASLSALTDEPNKISKPDTQGRTSSREGKEGHVKNRTWTRVACFAQKGDAQAKAEAAGTSKRFFMEIDDCELPNKRRLGKAEMEEAGIGVIVRDGKGYVIATLVEKIPYPGSVEVLEALAARRAAKFVVELELSGSEFEGDSEVVWRALKSADGAHSSIGEIIKDTMSIVGSL